VVSKKEIIKVSATRISSFLRCRLKYWFNYHEHLPKVSNPAFLLGRAVHESLDLAGQIWMTKGFFTADDRKKILDLYENVSIREGVEDLSIHQEGKRLINNRLDDFALGKGIISLEYEFGNKGNDIITPEGVYLIGAIDKVVEVDEDTLLIVDYKTSKTIPTPDQLKEDLQLSIYDVVASIKWPDYKRIILCLDLLKSEILYTYRTIEQRESFRHYLRLINDQMYDLKKKDAKASLNLFYPRCDYKDYCDIYKEACKKSDYKFLSALNYSQEDLMKEWSTVRDTKKILEERERELSMIMIEKIKMTGVNLVNDSEELYIRQNSRTNYDVGVVSKLVPYDDFKTMVNLNKKAVSDYLDANPAIKEEVEGSVQASYTSPFLSIKKIKK
jgi:hypothetical protein